MATVEELKKKMFPGLAESGFKKMSPEEIVKAGKMPVAQPPAMGISHGPGSITSPIPGRTYQEGSAYGLIPGSLPGSTSTLTGQRLTQDNIADIPRTISETPAGETVPLGSKPLPGATGTPMLKPRPLPTTPAITQMDRLIGPGTQSIDVAPVDRGWQITPNARYQRPVFAGENLPAITTPFTTESLPTTGGNITQLTDAQTIKDVAARREANSAQLDKSLASLTDLNLMQGAHGPAEARRVAALIANRDAAAARLAGTHANAALETEKAKADIALKTSEMMKNYGLIDQTKPFNPQEASEKALALTKDPAKADIIAQGWQRKYAGTGTDVYHKIDVYGSDFKSTMPMIAYGNPEKANAGFIAPIIENIKNINKQIAGKWWLSDMEKQAYNNAMNTQAEALYKYGVVLLPDQG